MNRNEKNDIQEKRSNRKMNKSKTYLEKPSKRKRLYKNAKIIKPKTEKMKE